MDTQTLSGKIAALAARVAYPGRPDDFYNWQLEDALRECDNDLNAVVRRAFPSLPWDGVVLPSLDEAERLNALWREWCDAESALRRCCQSSNRPLTSAEYMRMLHGEGIRECPGEYQFQTLDGLPCGERCRVPVLQADGTVTWKGCPKNERGLQRVQDQWLRKCGVPRRFLGATLENFDVGADSSLGAALRKAKEFVGSFSGDKLWDQEAGLGVKGLVLVGPAGTGKTHLACATVAALIHSNVPVYYRTVADLLAELRAGIEKNEVETVLSKWRRVSVLCLDDLGKEYLAVKTPAASGGYETAAWAHEELFRLVDYRYADERPCIITSNLGDRELTARYGPPLVSRLHEMADWLILNVKDRRRGGGQ